MIFLPVVLFILILIHFRRKLNFFSLFLIYLDVFFNSRKKRFAVYFMSFLIPILIGYLLYKIPSSSDVQIAMTGAIQAFLNGKNPFYYTVVPHVLLFPSGIKKLVMGTYNYGPIDLLSYSIGYIIFHPFVGSPWWLYFSNLLLLVGIYLVIRSLIALPDLIKIIPFMIIFSIFLGDNVLLMCFFLSLAWYVHLKSNYRYKSVLVTFLITLGILTKLFVAFVLLGYFIYIFRTNLKLWIINAISVTITGFLVIIPFGILNVIKSIFIFHVDLSVRANYATIQGGLTIYLMLLHLTSLFIPVAILLTIFFLYICNKYFEQIELKFGIFTILNLLVLPDSNYAFFIIPVFFLLLYFYKQLYKNYILYEKLDDPVLIMDETTNFLKNG